MSKQKASTRYNAQVRLNLSLQADATVKRRTKGATPSTPLFSLLDLLQ